MSCSVVLFCYIYSVLYCIYFSRHKSTCIRFLSCKVVFCRCITQFFVASTFHGFSRHKSTCIRFLSCKVVLCRCITQFFVASTFHDLPRHKSTCIRFLSCKVVLCRCITQFFYCIYFSRLFTTYVCLHTYLVVQSRALSLHNIVFLLHLLFTTFHDISLPAYVSCRAKSCSVVA